MSEYTYSSAAPSHTHSYLFRPALALAKRRPAPCRVFELGCGSGGFANALDEAGYDVTAIDISESGVRHAKEAYPGCRFEVGSGYDDLAGKYGTFDLVISLEVVEHLYSPRLYAATVRDLLNPGGIAIISTPYHGYVKNLALAASGRMDNHFTALWDHGHIKLWSRETLRALFGEVGMREAEFHRVGRFSALAKSMISVFER